MDFMVPTIVSTTGFIAGMITMAAIYRSEPSAHRGKQPVAPELTTYTDQETGCQYIASSSGGITPRLMQDGRPFLGDDHE